MSTKRIHPAWLTMLGVILLVGSIGVNIILQNSDTYTTEYLLVGFSGVILIVWNGPKWLQNRQRPHQ